MKKFKHLVVHLFLVIILVCSSNNITFAAETNSNAGFSATLEIISYPYSFERINSDNLGQGHSFIVVRNFNAYSIRVGHYSVPAKKSVTVSVFDNRKNHSGIWYNIESYAASEINNTQIAKLSKGITQNELNTLNTFLNSNDYYNLFSHNCTSFSVGCWNSVSPATLSANTPTTLYQNIKKNSSCLTNANLPYLPISSIAYQTPSSVCYDTSGAYPKKS